MVIWLHVSGSTVRRNAMVQGHILGRAGHLIMPGKERGTWAEVACASRLPLSFLCDPAGSTAYRTEIPKFTAGLLLLANTLWSHSLRTGEVRCALLVS